MSESLSSRRKRLTVVARAGDPAVREKIGQRLKASEQAAEYRFTDVDDDT